MAVWYAAGGHEVPCYRLASQIGARTMPDTISATPAPKTPGALALRRVAQSLAFMAMWIALLFACAGSLHWTRGWICAITYLVGMLGMGSLVYLRNPDLFPARAKWRRSDTKPFDRIILAIYTPLIVVQPAVAGLDAVRFHWSSMPFWTVYSSVILFLLGMGLASWTLSVNRWAETTVRIQSERGQQVVRAGPYRFVRHPMYLGSIIMYAATAGMLGSWWALAIAAIIALLLIVRTAFEDRMLQRELPGYREFAAITRWRLVPGIW